ncbi:DUF2514 family protein [Pseudomonas sp. KCJK8806]|uniref:DUF2514 family protein n=1 Tax=Pseudomonas sp. KCJK8806 TaxID=3344559 RepID=UPI00390670D3
MSWLAAVPAWCWWLIALVVDAGGQQYRVVVAQGETAEARTELADYRLVVAENSRRAAAQARAEEQRRQKAADEEGEHARKKLEEVTSRATAAESAAGGLYDEIKRLRDGHRATCDTIASQQRKAGASAVVVLGGLLEESDRMAGSCAAALERSRIAGLACEAVVERMKGP